MVASTKTLNAVILLKPLELHQKVCTSLWFDLKCTAEMY